MKKYYLKRVINKDIQADDPNKTAEVVPLYLSPSIINNIICINTIATAIAIMNPNNKYFISCLIHPAFYFLAYSSWNK